MPSRGINKVILIGNLGSDPEVRHTPNGDAVASFSLATNESWKDKNGEAKERTEWHKLVLWRKLAEIAGQYLKKGAQVYVEGKLQTRTWEKDGVKRSATEVVVSEMQMLGDRKGGNDHPARSYAAPDAEETYGQSMADSGDNDLPF